MKKSILITILMLFALGGHAQSLKDQAALKALLAEFLDGASRNDAAIHDKFWAEELVYTGSGGTRRGKTELMKGVRSAPPPKRDDPASNYTAEDIRIQQYGNTAIVAFKLVNTITNNGKTYVDSFLNTGTFLKRRGKWSVVAWQATRIPLADDEAKRRAAEAEAAFHSAFLNGDAKALEAITDESFIWTHNTGRLIPRKALIDFLDSGKLKYSKIENRDVTVNVYGDTAVVRGISSRQHISYPDGTPPDKEPLATFYTITLANRGGGWKLVAMQTGR